MSLPRCAFKFGSAKSALCCKACPPWKPQSRRLDSNGVTQYPIQYNAHKLKGSAMLLGFRAIVKKAKRIEQLATDSAGPPLPTGLDMQLILDMEATQLALRHFESARAV